MRLINGILMMASMPMLFGGMPTHAEALSESANGRFSTLKPQISAAPLKPTFQPGHLSNKKAQKFNYRGFVKRSNALTHAGRIKPSIKLGRFCNLSHLSNLKASAKQAFKSKGHQPQVTRDEQGRLQTCRQEILVSAKPFIKIAYWSPVNGGSGNGTVMIRFDSEVMPRVKAVYHGTRRLAASPFNDELLANHAVAFHLPNPALHGNRDLAGDLVLEMQNGKRFTLERNYRVEMGDIKAFDYFSPLDRTAGDLARRSSMAPDQTVDDTFRDRDWRNAYLLSVVSRAMYRDEAGARNETQWHRNFKNIMREMGLPQSTTLESSHPLLGIFSNIFSAVSSNDDVIVVSFRGTDVSYWDNITTDINLTPQFLGNGVFVHQGFHLGLMAVYGDLIAEIERHRNNNQKVWFTGHSLGGAMALLAGYYYEIYENRDVEGIVTFEAPLVGNQAFANSIRTVTQQRRTVQSPGSDFDVTELVSTTVHNRLGFTFWRWATELDPVTIVPPAPYKHTGVHNYIYRDGRIDINAPTRYLDIDTVGFNIANHSIWDDLMYRHIMNEHGQTGRPSIMNGFLSVVPSPIVNLGDHYNLR